MVDMEGHMVEHMVDMEDTGIHTVDLDPTQDTEVVTMDMEIMAEHTEWHPIQTTQTISVTPSKQAHNVLPFPLRF